MRNYLVSAIMIGTIVSFAWNADARQRVTITTTGPASPVLEFYPADIHGRTDTRKKLVFEFEDGTVLDISAPREYNGAELGGWTINAPTKTRSVAQKGRKGPNLKVPLVDGEYTISADYILDETGETVGPTQAPVVYKKGGVPILGGLGRFMADLTHKPEDKQDASKPVESNNRVSNFFTTIFGSNQQQ